MSDLQETHAALLAAELRATSARLKRRLREEGGAGDHSPSQIAVLLRMERDGAATTSHLARAEGMRPQSMAAVIAVLEAAGHIVGVPDRSDGRQKLFSLTPECRQWMEQRRAARQDWLTRTIAARLDAEEQRALAAAVELLKRIVD